MIIELEGIELQPCPFCGEAATLKGDTTASQGSWYWVKCGDPQCRATQAANPDKSAVIAAWNQRRNGDEQLPVRS